MTTIEECRHANTDNCHECLRNELKELQKLFSDPDTKYLDPPELFAGLQRHVKFALDRIADMEQNELQHVAPDHSDAESFHTTREESSEQHRTFHPRVVAGSGFARRNDNHEVSPKVPPRPRSPTKSPQAARTSTSPPRASRIRWTEAEIEQLGEGVRRFGKQWREIQQHYPKLKRFTNVQLKDKYRTAFGSRS